MFSKVAQTATNMLNKLNMKEPVRVAVTGAAGNIGYATLFRIAAGEMLGPDQPVILHLIDIPDFMGKCKGVEMELYDCAFPLLAGVVCESQGSRAYKDVDYALLIGAKPRGPGMERADLLKDNGKIFIQTGTDLGQYASRDVKVLVVGNPANTNCLIAAHYANKQGLPKENFNAMTRLDHDRALSQLAMKLGCHIDDIDYFAVWGNHSPTMYPDATRVTVKGELKANELSQEWVNKTFIPEVQQRGAAIIKARGLSSAASAGNAAIAHMRDWVRGTDKWVSMSIPSDGSYGIPEGVVFSYPCTVKNGQAQIVQDLVISEASKAAILKSHEELLQERKLVADLLK